MCGDRHMSHSPHPVPKSPNAEHTLGGSMILQGALHVPTQVQRHRHPRAGLLADGGVVGLVLGHAKLLGESWNRQECAPHLAIWGPGAANGSYADPRTSIFWR